jgi:hypothetical protein
VDELAEMLPPACALKRRLHFRSLESTNVAKLFGSLSFVICMLMTEMKVDPARTRLLAWLGVVSFLVVLALAAFAAQTASSESVVDLPSSERSQDGLPKVGSSKSLLELEIPILGGEPLELLDFVTSLDTEDIDLNLDEPLENDATEGVEDARGLDLGGAGLDVNELGLPDLL